MSIFTPAVEFTVIRGGTADNLASGTKLVRAKKRAYVLDLSLIWRTAKKVNLECGLFSIKGHRVGPGVVSWVNVFP